MYIYIYTHRHTETHTHWDSVHNIAQIWYELISSD